MLNFKTDLNEGVIFEAELKDGKEFELLGENFKLEDSI